MRVVPLEPDVSQPVTPVSSAQNNAFGNSIELVASALRQADRAENRYAAGIGSLQGAVLERARADVVLSVATAAVQRTATTLQSILNLQI